MNTPAQAIANPRKKPLRNQPTSAALPVATSLGSRYDPGLPALLGLGLYRLDLILQTGKLQ
jgi:hypothetical protein